MTTTAPRFCYVCKRTEEERELRPYGKGGKPICAPCAQSDPARAREAELRMNLAINAGKPLPPGATEALVLTPDGPVSRTAFMLAEPKTYRPGQTIAAVAAVGQPKGGIAMVASCANPVDLGVATVVMCRTLLSFPQVYNQEIQSAARALVEAIRGNDAESVDPLQVVDHSGEGEKGPS